MLFTNTKAKVLTFGLLPIILVVVGVTSFLLARGWPVAAVVPSSGIMPISAAIEQRWGIRVTQIGVTADGGMVDFRYLVLDPDKALAMLADVKNVPVLLAEDDRMIVNSAALMPAKHNLNPGQTYFFLYRNTNGAIKPGGAVTVRLGELTLEHVVAK